jgi:DDE superfamily endonuclease
MAMAMAMAVPTTEVKQIHVTPQVYINLRISRRKWKLFPLKQKGPTSQFIRTCMDNNIKLLILPLHSSHCKQPLDVAVFSPLKHYLAEELQGVFQTVIAQLFKSEWAVVYAKARPKAFTISNINGS